MCCEGFGRASSVQACGKSLLEGLGFTVWACLGHRPGCNYCRDSLVVGFVGRPAGRHEWDLRLWGFEGFRMKKRSEAALQKRTS